MPKRSNPFGDHSSLQLKTHVRTKEVDNGICQQARMQSVYACHNCRQPVEARNVMKCQFCENYVCGPCVRQCGKCYLHFCQLCSILNYNQTSERSFCLTCSGR